MSSGTAAHPAAAAAQQNESALKLCLTSPVAISAFPGLSRACTKTGSPGSLADSGTRSQFFPADAMLNCIQRCMPQL